MNLVAIGPFGSVVAVGTTAAQGFAGGVGVGQGVGFVVIVATPFEAVPPFRTLSKQVVDALPPLIITSNFVVVTAVVYGDVALKTQSDAEQP